jgi:hypothetical protein
VRHSVVEANRFLLRDMDGKTAGGMEVSQDGTIRIVLGSGYGTMGAAFLEVQRNGNAHLTMRGPDGAVRATLLATPSPSLALSSGSGHSAATFTTMADGSGAVMLSDAAGRLRFKAP